MIYIAEKNSWEAWEPCEGGKCSRFLATVEPSGLCLPNVWIGFDLLWEIGSVGIDFCV